MKLDDWLTRLVPVPPGRSPLANGLAIGMRIAAFILVPFGIIAAIAILLLHR
jgi:threonine/homoserine efflux transporter RhtA